MGESGSVARRLSAVTDSLDSEMQPPVATSDKLSAYLPAADHGRSSAQQMVRLSRASLAGQQLRTIRCTLERSDDNQLIAAQLLYLSLIIAGEVETDGGLLLHGALAEWQGNGVILAGPGGVGKTTASRRLPPSWQSLSDDATLVVPDRKGIYWAHPWPTWSQFMFGGPGGSWDVQHAVPLRAIFFLNQASKERTEPVSPAVAVCLLNEAVEQCSWVMLQRAGADVARAHRLLRFDTTHALAKSLPVYRLNLSRTGAFWSEIEQTLVGSSRVRS